MDTKTKIFFISTFAVLLFSTEYLFREYFNRISTGLVKNVLKKQGDLSYCDFLKILQFFENDGRFLLLFIIFNFTNTFAALSFVLLDSFTVFLNGVLKIIYQQPRPFWVETEIMPCTCAVNFGNPSTTGINQFILFAITYKAFTLTYKNLNKILVGFICAIPVTLIYSSRLFQGIHSINQLFFGLGIGIIVYYIYFEILSVNFESKTHFNFFFRNFYTICFCVITFFLSLTFLHIYVIKIEHNQVWLGVFNRYCDTINNYSLFDNEGYKKSSKLFLFVGCLTGIFLENQLLFHSNHKSFLLYSIHPTYRFSKTPIHNSLFRVCIMMAAYLLVFKLFVEDNSDQLTDSFFYITLSSFIIPYLIYGILIFFFSKVLVRYIGLTNETLFDDSYDHKNSQEMKINKYNSFYDELVSTDSTYTLQFTNDLKDPLLQSFNY